MPGYFPSGGWPSIAKTTPGIIRGTVHKHLDRYVPAMNEAIHNQLRTLSLNESDGKFLESRAQDYQCTIMYG